MSSDHVYIVLLNWNGWQDTIECLESIFRLDYPSYTVIVCDNASTDNSLEQIRRWADGDLLAPTPSQRLAHLTTPPIAKPIKSILYPEPPSRHIDSPPQCSLVLIQTGSNRGFASGCNVGLRYSLAQANCDHVWLLNNDTVVEKSSLSGLIERVQSEPRMGICGSVLMHYHSPDDVQAYGGRRYSAWCARVLPDIRTKPGEDADAYSIDYVLGASMLVRREFLETVGLMEEAYCFYFEELDWAARAGRRFLIGYAPLSYVYHKEGASLGTRSCRAARSSLSEWYVARSRILFTRKFHPAFLASVLACVGCTALHRLLTGNAYKAGQIALAAWEGLTYPGLKQNQ